MLEHVLVTLDGSDLSEKAIAAARDVVGEGGTVTLLRVVDMPQAYEDAVANRSDEIPAEEASYDVMADRAKSYLKKHTDAFRAANIATEVLIKEGKPATVIVETAIDLAVDAIVMCTHGRSGVQRWLHGSVTRAVMRQMPCLLVVVPGHQDI